MADKDKRETPVEKVRRRLREFDSNIKQIKEAQEMGRAVGAERQKNLNELERIRGRARATDRAKRKEE